MPPKNPPSRREVSIADAIVVANDRPFVFFGGMNVLESEDTTFRVADHLTKVSRVLGIPLVFKASFDKANRTSIASYRGPGVEEALRLFEAIKSRFAVPIVTDVHEPDQAPLFAKVVDVIQVPAMLSRQTDLLKAACLTGLPLLVKKMQTMAPEEMTFVVEKCESFGGRNLILCERGTMFGYGNLIVDPLAFPKLKELGYPVAFDVTHSLQTPGSLGSETGGRSQYTESLAVAAMSQGIAALFMECHPDPHNAKCDGGSALPLADVERVLRRLQAYDELSKR